MATPDDWTEFFSVQNNITRKEDKFPEQIPKLNYSYNENQSDIFEFTNFTSDDFCSSNYSRAYLNVTCEFPINYAEPMYG